MKDELLDRKEWDFTDIPTDELESAWQYELARTVKSCVMDQAVCSNNLAGDPPRKLDLNKDDDAMLWYENTVGWYDDWASSNEISAHTYLPWTSLPAKYKTKYLIAHKGEIPAHLTHDHSYTMPYSRTLVHLEYNPSPNSQVLQKRHNYLKAQDRPVTSLHLFEIHFRRGIDSRSSMINDFKKFLEEEFPNMPDKVGRPKSKMPELTNLAIFRLLIHYTPDETISKIAGTYSQRRRISLKELEKAEKAVCAQMQGFCKPYRTRFTPKPLGPS